jgi:ubiquinone/menaquinone biosynthesis C-methylase UbiE
VAKTGKRKTICCWAGICTVMLLLLPFLTADSGSRISPAQDNARDQDNKNVKPAGEDFLYFDSLEVVLEDFSAEGWILDIGGGGEGIIGQLKGSQCVAIDISKRELVDAPPGPLKIVMDGRDLKFLDGVFNTTTVFFTFMYIDPDDHRKVFEEVFRVLAPNGRLLIWDVIFPKRSDPKKKTAVFPLHVTLPAKEVRTGYGVRWPEKGQGLDHYLQLAEKIGFTTVSKKVGKNWFYLELKKSAEMIGVPIK